MHNVNGIDGVSIVKRAGDTMLELERGAKRNAVESALSLTSRIVVSYTFLISDTGTALTPAYRSRQRWRPRCPRNRPTALHFVRRRNPSPLHIPPSILHSIRLGTVDSPPNSATNGIPSLLTTHLPAIPPTTDLR